MTIMYGMIMMGGIPAGPELLVIVGVFVLLFGANKIPQIARSLGKAGGEFKRGREELESEIEADETTEQ